MIPIFKLGNKDNIGSYCPIALLSNLSKILEKLIKNRFTKFLCKNKILYPNQYGFRKNHSVIHALMDILTNAYDAINNNHYTTLIFMDFCKAFDTVCHKILLDKLYHYGIKGPDHSLIENYFYRRQQFVTINNASSSYKAINIGIPQGSILGPLLFLIYINNLPNALHTNPCLFADDTCSFLNHSSLTSLENICATEVSRLKDWCNANKIQINSQKSFILPISHKLNVPNLNLNLPFENSKINSSQICKYLGVLLNDKLNFKSHILQLEIKLAKYALPIWGSTFPSYFNKLQRFQNKCIRIIFNISPKTSVSPYYYKLKILELADLYIYEIAKIMHQHSQKALPDYLSSFFTTARQIYNCPIRSHSYNTLYLPKFSTSRC